MPTTNPGELFHRTGRCIEMFEDFETRDDVGSTIGERQHSGIGVDSRGGGQPLEGEGQLVVAIFDPDE